MDKVGEELENILSIAFFDDKENKRGHVLYLVIL
jgi:hypothetical protein